MNDDSSQSIDPNEVEILIDSSRLSCNWEDVLHWLKRYAHIFDIGAATSTFQHGNLDSVRAYYWVVMAETVFETKSDSTGAFDCAKRAIDINIHCTEASVIVSRVLLHSYRAVLKNDGSSNNSNDASGVEKEPASSVGEAIKGLPKRDQKFVMNVIAALDQRSSGALTSSLEFLEAEDIQSVCREFLALAHAHHGDSVQDIKENGKIFVLLTARQILSKVKIDDVVTKYVTGRMSEYRFWLFLDAIATRIGISESLGEAKKAREEGQRLVQLILSISNDDERDDEDHDHDRGNENYESVVARMPESCRNVILAIACRIPLIEMREGMANEALESFHVCISGDSQLKNHYPIPIQLGLYVQCALYMLHRAKVACGKMNGASDRVVYAAVSEDVRSDIDNAFSLLASAHDMMTLRVDSDTASNSAKLSASGIDSSPMSQLSLLPSAATANSDPRSIADFASSSIIGPFMAVMCKLRESGDLARRKSIAVLEWGISLEIKPRSDLLWLLASAYSDGGKHSYAINLLEQCHFTALSGAAASGRLEDAMAPARASGRNLSSSGTLKSSGSPLGDEAVAKLLCWLGAGLSPSTPCNLWLPLTRAAELAMDHQNDYEAAREFARRGLLEVYEHEGLAILNALGSDSAMLYESAVSESATIMGSTRPLEKYRNTQGTLSIPMSLQPSISMGVCALVFVLGKCHAGLGRKASTKDTNRVGHLRVAVRAFDLLLRSVKEKFGRNTSAFLKSIEGELILQHAVAMAELGEGSKAITSVRTALGASRFSTSSKLLHLLGLLLASTGDDPLVFGTAAALCKRASQLPAIEPCSVTATSSSATAMVTVDEVEIQMDGLETPRSVRKPIPSPNARLTLAVLELTAGGQDSGSLKAVDQTVTAMLADFRGITEWEVSVRELAISAGAAAVTTSSAFPWSPSKAAARGSVSEADPEDVSFPEDAARRLDNPHYVSLIVNMLITCSRCYKRAGKSVKAKLCLEEAWKLLFTPSKDTLHSIGELLCPELRDGGGDGSVSEHKRIDIMRRVPTLAGWRLSEASGWGSRGLPELESAVLHETALQTDDVHIALELLQMSLTLCPDNAATLIALADFELKRVESIASQTASESSKPAASSSASVSSDPNAYFSRIPSAPTDTKSKHSSSSRNASTDLASLCQESKAYSYAMAAVRARDLSPDAWYVLGRVYQALGQAAEAEEAFTTALECMKFDPMRNFSVVFSDHFLRPGQ